MERARLSLDGLSVGDAFGECFFCPSSTVESLIAQRVMPQVPWRRTDDSEMAISIVRVLGDVGRIDQDALAEAFARRYATDSGRGYGSKAHLILGSIADGLSWRIVSPSVFGGDGSMGNGGAMRVAPLGAYFSDDLDRVVVEARASAEVTHAHPDGQAGAIAVAVAAATAWRMRGRLAPDSGRKLLEAVCERTPDGETRQGLAMTLKLPPGSDVRAAVDVLGNGGRVLSMDTVPFALWCAARHLDSFVDALWTTVSGLGDRDTICAMVGGIVALSAPPPSIPPDWLAAREPLGMDG